MKKLSLAAILLCTLTLVGQSPSRQNERVSYSPTSAESGARLIRIRQQVLRECSFAPRSERCRDLKELYRWQTRSYQEQQGRMREAQAKKGN